MTYFWDMTYRHKTAEKINQVVSAGLVKKTSVKT